MQDIITRIDIDDIADMTVAHSLFGLGEGDTLDISLMDIVIAVIVRQ